MMKYLLAVFCIFNALLCSKAENIDLANRYVDEVLSIYVPWAIKEAGLQVHQLPNFSVNIQNRSHDGGATTGKIYYHSGNVTGLQNVQRKTCNEPRWEFGNITVHCNIDFPKVYVKYQARYQTLTGIENGVRFRKIDFSIFGSLKDFEADIIVTASPLVKTPAIKALTIVNFGTPAFVLSETSDLDYGTLMTHFYHRFNEVYIEAFYDVYRKAFERAVQSIPYPFE